MDQALVDIGFAVVDVETTGFGPKHRIVELAIVHFDCASEPILVFDSVIRPDRRVGNREVHGISNRDVRKAPQLADVAGTVCDLLADRILVAHNVAFDKAFIGRELGSGEVRWPIPSLCTMELHRVVYGGRATLEDACSTVGIPVERAQHYARDDALLAALVFRRQLDALAKRNIGTLVSLQEFAPTALLDDNVSPLSAAEARAIFGRSKPCSRRKRQVGTQKKQPPSSPTYEVALRKALGKQNGKEKVDQLRTLQNANNLDELAAQHASTFGLWITAEAGSSKMGVTGRERVRRALRLLADLGWAPGEWGVQRQLEWRGTTTTLAGDDNYANDNYVCRLEHTSSAM
ncbi:MAG: 3'-5' exonuclease [Proteobacteria bacterium]|jgi:DNA polymerase III epsilon subunit-like protein|nr:3'-5' exonuclease [Pseudomonadota bacterium]